MQLRSASIRVRRTRRVGCRFCRSGNSPNEGAERRILRCHVLGRAGLQGRRRFERHRSNNQRCRLRGRYRDRPTLAGLRRKVDAYRALWVLAHRTRHRSRRGHRSAWTRLRAGVVDDRARSLRHCASRHRRLLDDTVEYGTGAEPAFTDVRSLRSFVGSRRRRRMVVRCGARRDPLAAQGTNQTSSMWNVAVHAVRATPTPIPE